MRVPGTVLLGLMRALALFCCLFAAASGQTNLTGLAVNGSGLYVWNARTTGIEVIRLLENGYPEVFSIAHSNWDAYVVVNGTSLKVDTSSGIVGDRTLVPGSVLSAAVCNGAYTAIISKPTGVSIWSVSTGEYSMPGVTSAAVGLAACDVEGQYWTELELSNGNSSLYRINPRTGTPRLVSQSSKHLLALVGGVGPILLAQADNTSVNIGSVAGDGQVTLASVVDVSMTEGYVYSVAGREADSLLYAMSAPAQTVLKPADIAFPATLELLSLYSIPPLTPTTSSPASSPSPPPGHSFAGGYPGGSLSSFTWTDPTVLTFQGVVTLSGELVINLPSGFQLDGDTLVLFTFADGTMIDGEFASVIINNLDTSFCVPPTVEYGASSIYLLFGSETTCTLASTFSVF